MVESTDLVPRFCARVLNAHGECARFDFWVSTGLNQIGRDAEFSFKSVGTSDGLGLPRGRGRVDALGFRGLLGGSDVSGLQMHDEISQSDRLISAQSLSGERVHCGRRSRPRTQGCGAPGSRCSTSRQCR